MSTPKTKSSPSNLQLLSDEEVATLLEKLIDSVVMEATAHRSVLQPQQDSVLYSYSDFLGSPLYTNSQEVIIQSNSEHSDPQPLPDPSANITHPTFDDYDPPVSSATAAGLLEDDDPPQRSGTATVPSNPLNQGDKRNTSTKRTEMVLKELKFQSQALEKKSIAIEGMAIKIAEMNQSIKSIADSLQKLTDHVINKKD